MIIRLNKDELEYKIGTHKVWIRPLQIISIILFMASLGVFFFFSYNAAVFGFFLSMLFYLFSMHISNMVKFDEIKLELIDKK